MAVIYFTRKFQIQSDHFGLVKLLSKRYQSFCLYAKVGKHKFKFRQIVCILNV